MNAEAFPPPRIRLSLLWKITLPFVFLAMVLGLGATYLVNRFLSAEQSDRFLRQLVDSGQQATDAIVRAEMDLLGLERLIANTEGVADSAEAGDAEDLRARVLPLVVNAGADAVAILDREGTSLLAVRREPAGAPGDYETLRGETYYTEWPFVRRVLQGVADDVVGDKHAGVEQIILGGESQSIFFVAGPLFDDARTLVGAVLVGEYLSDLASSVATESAANITVYSPHDGSLLTSTLEPEADSLKIEAESLQSLSLSGESPVRQIEVAGTSYWEILTPLVARQGTEAVGVLGVSLIRLELDAAASEGFPSVVQLGAVALAMIVIIGLLISTSITRPLVDLVKASTLVAMGRLDTQVPAKGSDEVGALSATFNQMVGRLREGRIFRDLLGGNVTPEVRQQLRSAFLDGSLRLSGQRAVATILVAEFRGYRGEDESSRPAAVMKSLNDYFAGVVPVISLHGGVVSKFDADCVMAFFGILPQHLPPKVSALKATHAGVSLIDHVDRLNESRAAIDQSAFEIGIGIATGEVIAGGLGSEQRVHYTVLGETVDVAQRIQQVALQLGGSALVVSQDTYRHLGALHSQFKFGQKGLAQLPGKREELIVIQVLGRTTNLVKPGTEERTIAQYSDSWKTLGEELTDRLPDE